jgi:hypothetical protein
MSNAATDTDEDFVPPPPRKRSRWLRRFALVILVLGAVFVLVLFLARFQLGRLGQRELDATSATLDANDPGWRLDAILEARKKTEPPAAENSALVVLKIAEEIPEDWRKWRNSDPGSAFWVGRAENRLPPPVAIEGARKHAADTLFVRGDAIRLRDRRGGQFPLTLAVDPITTPLPHLDKCRTVVSLLQYDGYLAAIEKNPNRGISAARAALAVARAIGDEPLLVSQLVRIAVAVVAAQTAMQVIAWGEPTDGLAELQAELLAEADAGHFLIGIRGERAVVDKVFRGLEDGTIPAENWFVYAGIQKPGPEHYAAFRAYRPLIPGDHAKALEILSAYTAIAKRPPNEHLRALKAVPIPEGPPEEIRYIMTRLLVPASEKVAEAGLRCRAELVAAATCVACERFRLKHNRWPFNFEELIPTYLPAMPWNPFFGAAPFAYSVFPDRIAIYAYWPNAPIKPEDCPKDFRPGAGRTAAIGYRVWKPDQRGLPAEEKRDP